VYFLHKSLDFNLNIEYNITMTTIIYCKNSSSKKKGKPTAKQRELAAAWEKMLKKYTPKKLVTPKQELRDVYSLGTPACRETPKHPSLNSGYHDCTKKPSPVYTGTKIKGIGTMHKSNAVPVFSDQEAKDIATMRRG
jgi:hypothetical protein